jgi:hypothetical protein
VHVVWHQAAGTSSRPCGSAGRCNQVVCKVPPQLPP